MNAERGYIHGPRCQCYPCRSNRHAGMLWNEDLNAWTKSTGPDDKDELEKHGDPITDARLVKERRTERLEIVKPIYTGLILQRVWRADEEQPIDYAEVATTAVEAADALLAAIDFDPSKPILPPYEDGACGTAVSQDAVLQDTSCKHEWQYIQGIVGSGRKCTKCDKTESY